MALELLSQAIHEAHRDLVEPSPDSLVPALHTEGASWSLTSPVIEKVRRRKTTMEEFGSSSNIEIGMNKVLKTYGSQKTRKEKALRGGGVHDRWAEGWPDADSAEHNDDVFWHSQESKKSKTTVVPDNTLVTEGVPQRKRLKRRVTTAGPATESVYMCLDDQHQESLLSLRMDAEKIDFTALEPSATVSSEHLEHLTLPLMENSMLHPMGKSELLQQALLKTSISSTIPNTSIGTGQSHSIPSADPVDSSARMTSPTISGKSSKEVLTQSTDHVDDALEYLREGFVEEHTAHDAHTPAPKEFTKNTVAALPSTQGSAPGTQDELSMIASKDKELQTAIQKKKPKRKLSGNSDFDELGSDEAAVGLPAEHYQPRPSRSRANRTVDDLVLAIDYSKRPEAVVKARNKRRKTDGDQLAAAEEKVDVGLTGSWAIAKTEQNEQQNYSPQKHNSEGIPVARVVKVGGSIEEEDIAISVVDSELPKKRRGRPKKQNTTDDDSQVMQKISQDVIGVVDDADMPSTTTTGSIAKKPRKRKKTQESVAISEEIVIEDDESTSVPQKIVQEHDHATKEDTILEDSQNMVNIIKAPVQPVKTKTQLNQDTSEASDTTHPNPPPETPKKAVAKAPGKHSPLNTGKVPYRVGLSKRARIEPLLRVLRK